LNENNAASKTQKPPPMTVIEKTFISNGGKRSTTTAAILKHSHHDASYRTLNFIMLGCETKAPYGPLTHTAQLLTDLLGMAAINATQSAGISDDSISCNWVIRIHIYNAQEMEYPEDWDECDGILIPGSFSAAYDTDPWIERLKAVIQQHIVPFHRPTLGICFGHQIFAHSFTKSTDNENVENHSGFGHAVPMRTGPRAGRFTMPINAAGIAGKLPKSGRDKEW
jgi:Glutamine amidotransferase class-I